MDHAALQLALARLGNLVDFHQDIDLVLVGGAAGMLSGQLAATRVTTDCDVLLYVPAGALPAIERAAATVATELELDPRWLNSDVSMLVHLIPSGWEERQQLAGAWGRIRVFVVSRLDLIAMKFLAGRAQDIDDLRAMNPTAEERIAVAVHVRELRARGADPVHLDDAAELVDAWEDLR